MREALSIVLVVLVACVVPKPAHSEEPTPRTALPLGTWDVERVLIDPTAGMGSNILPDDPALVGRTLVVQPSDLHFVHGGWRHCHQERWKRQVTTWRKLFADRMCLRTNETATPEIYRAPLSPDAKISLFSICEHEVPAQGPFKGEWIAMDGPDRLVMAEDCQALLIFKRRTATAPIKASFSCRNAKSETEKTICSDFELASLDRSVAAAFELAQSAWPSVSEARCAQRVWLAVRDACRSDVDCLKTAMFDRAGSLALIARNGSLQDMRDVEDGQSCSKPRKVD